METDYISREAAVKKFEDAEYLYDPEQGAKRFTVEDAKDILNAIPAAEVRAVVKGEWVKNKDRVGWHCSVCNGDNNFAYSWNSETGKNEFQDNYCPCCGAKMGGTP